MKAGGLSPLCGRPKTQAEARLTCTCRGRGPEHDVVALPEELAHLNDPRRCTKTHRLVVTAQGARLVPRPRTLTAA